MSGSTGVPHYNVLKALLALSGGADLIGKSGGGTVQDAITALLAADALLAPLASPALTGNPTAPTQTAGNNSDRIATTAFVEAVRVALINGAPGNLNDLNKIAASIGDDADYAGTITAALALKAPLASPALTGNPTAPTQSANDNSGKIATTSYVDSAVNAGGDPGLVLLASAEADNDSAIDFTGVFDSTYEQYRIELMNVVPATDQAILSVRTSNDDGVSFDSGASDYQYQITRTHDTATWHSGVTGAELALTSYVDNGASKGGVSGSVVLVDPSDSGIYTRMYGHLPFWYGATSDDLYDNQFTGLRAAAEIVDGLRFFFSSGNIKSGKFNVFGVG